MPFMPIRTATAFTAAVIAAIAGAAPAGATPQILEYKAICTVNPDNSVSTVSLVLGPGAQTYVVTLLNAATGQATNHTIPQLSPYGNTTPVFAMPAGSYSVTVKYQNAMHQGQPDHSYAGHPVITVPPFAVQTAGGKKVCVHTAVPVDGNLPRSR